LIVKPGQEWYNLKVLGSLIIPFLSEVWFEELTPWLLQQLGHFFYSEKK